MTAEYDFVQHLSGLGVPIFTATEDKGNEFVRPKGWQRTDPARNTAAIASWKPGRAICGVMGGIAAAVDVDPRNGGDIDDVTQMLASMNVTVFGKVATPGDGRHFYVPGHPGLASVHATADRPGLVGFPGVDIQSFATNVFLPGTKRPKYNGKGYTVLDDNLLALADGGDPDGAEAFAAWVAERRTSRQAAFEPSPPWDQTPPDPRQYAYLHAVLANQAKQLAGMKPDSGRNNALYTAAMKLGNYVAGAGLDEGAVVAELTKAATRCRLTADDGPRSVEASIRSGLKQGRLKPKAVPAVSAEKRSVATQLVDLALTRWRFGISPEGDPFALPLKGAQVVRMLTGSRSIRAELADIFQGQTGKVAGQQALADAVITLEGRARRTDPVPLALRVAYVDGAVWLDLGTLTGEAVRIAPDGWEVVAAPPILFRRTALSGPLPAPTQGGDLAELWALLNVAPPSRPVLLAWLVSALLPEIPHPIAALVGEQGTGKTMASRILAALLDPSPAQLRKPPRDVEGWVTAAAGSWVVGVDNVSHLADWWSDAMCRAVTGDGDVRRRLYSDADLTVFSFRRVVLLNGIDLGAVRDHLADRLMTVELHRITERRSDADLTTTWEQAHPRILGALLDLAAQVLKVIGDVRLTDPPRMADFAHVLATVDHIQGTDGLGTYKALAADLAADAVTSDSTLTAITDTIREPWEGTAGELLTELGDGPKGDKSWPKNARAMSAVLRRRAPSLRRLGWTVDDLGRQGKACALRFLIEPPDTSDEASDRQATGKQQASKASKNQVLLASRLPSCLPVTPALTRGNVENAEKASKASVESHLLPLDLMNEVEGEGNEVENEATGKSVRDSSLPRLPACRRTPTSSVTRCAPTAGAPARPSRGPAADAGTCTRGSRDAHLSGLVEPRALVTTPAAVHPLQVSDEPPRRRRPPCAQGLRRACRRRGPQPTEGSLMNATDSRKPVICAECGADEMGCQVKAGLSGRRRCSPCTHGPDKENQR